MIILQGIQIDNHDYYIMEEIVKKRYKDMTDNDYEVFINKCYKYKINPIIAHMEIDKKIKLKEIKNGTKIDWEDIIND